MNIKTFVFNPFSENTYIVWDDNREAAVIDPGFFTKEEEEEFIDFVQEQNIVLSHCLLTHAHIDHILGCNILFNKYKLVPILHEKEEIVYKSAEGIAKMYGLGTIKFPGYQCLPENTTQYKIGTINLDILFTPGHSPGSVSFYSQEENLVFSGDVLFEGSIGRTDLPGGDFNTLIQSIKSELLTLPNETKVYSGHGNFTTIGQEKLTNPFL